MKKDTIFIILIAINQYCALFIPYLDKFLIFIASGQYNLAVQCFIT